MKIITLIYIALLITTVAINHEGIKIQVLALTAAYLYTYITFRGGGMPFKKK